MQITLVQAEIEAAIINFVTSQVNVKPEMRIDVDLTATRGANGFTATIDIVNKSTPRKDGQKAVPVTVVAEEPTKEVAVVVKVEEVVETVQEAAPTPPVALETPVQVNPLAPAATERPRSLFAGLQKPTNP